MKVLITGALGFIGSHLAEHVAKLGLESRLIDAVTYAGRVRNLPIGTRWGPADICDRELVAHHLRDFKPDWVIHCAAETHVGRSIVGQEDFLRTNVAGTHAMLAASMAYWRDADQCAKPFDFRFLQVSTDEVYGALAMLDFAWNETAPLLPNNPYSASKAAGDCLARAFWRTYGFPVIVTRGSNTYGPRQHPEKLIPTLIRQCLAGQKMTLHGDGLNVREWLHVDLHCSGILAALENGAPGEIYNLTSGAAYTNMDVARAVAKACEVEFAYDLVPDRPGNDRAYAMDASKALTTLGWSGAADFGEKLAAVVQWHRDNPHYEKDYGRTDYGYGHG